MVVLAVSAVYVAHVRRRQPAGAGVEQSAVSFENPMYDAGAGITQFGSTQQLQAGHYSDVPVSSIEDNFGGYQDVSADFGRFDDDSASAAATSGYADLGTFEQQQGYVDVAPHQSPLTFDDDGGSDESGDMDV